MFILILTKLNGLSLYCNSNCITTAGDGGIIGQDDQSVGLDLVSGQMLFNGSAIKKYPKGEINFRISFRNNVQKLK